MNIALSILLLTFGGLTFWLLAESQLKWYFKTACIFAFCTFTIIFWSTLHSFLGWPALDDDMPDKVLVHWVIVKEPNKQTGFSGSIYLLIESATQEKKSFFDFFGYIDKYQQPRLFGMPYSRKLHEQIENEMRGKLQRGQPVMGEFSKTRSGLGRKKNKGKPNKGEGSESQRQEWEFHLLRPSDFLQKPER